MKRSATIIAMLLVLTAFSTGVTAEVSWNSSMAVFMTYPDEGYDIGSEITVTVHVFNAGDYYDPDYVNLTVYGSDMRNVTLTKASTGIYRATFTIEADDVDEWNEMNLEATAGDDGVPWPDEATDWDYVQIGGDVEGEFRLMLEFADPADQNPSPGDTVEMVVETYWGTGPVDPDPGTLDVFYYDEDYEEIPIAMTKVGVGKYEGSFTIPSGITEGVYYEVEAMAEYTRDSVTYDAWDWWDVYVTFFEVWVHYADVTSTYSDIEVYVMDRDGYPIVGATVSYGYEYDDDNWDTQGDNLTGTTDEMGGVAFSLAYSDLGEYEYWIWAEVLVSHGGFTDYFDATIMVREYEEEIPEWGLHVSLATEQPLEPDKTQTLDFIAYYDGNPYTNDDITIYILDAETVHYHGTMTTAGDGSFQLTLKTPAVPDEDPWSYLDAYFQIETMMMWEGAELWIEVSLGSPGEVITDYLDPGTTISVGDCRLGEPVEVTLACDVADGSQEQAMIAWFPGPIDDWMTEWGVQPEWAPLGYTDIGIGGTWSDGAYHATLVVPIFLPEDVDLTFIGVVMFQDTKDIKAAILEDVTPLPPNKAPEVVITTPADGEQYGGTLTLEGTASDDEALESVEFRIDGGDWQTVTGTDSWSFELDTTTLASTTHHLEVRSYDGEKYSTLADLVFEVDQAPTATITIPATGQVVNGVVEFSGTATDDNAVDSVEFRIDGDTWYPATGTDAWTVELDTTMFTHGEHTLEIRCSDGERECLPIEVAFTVDQIPELELLKHVDGKRYTDSVKFSGTASDDSAVTQVEVRIDGGEWLIVDGTATWSFKVPTKGLKEGNHTVEIRAFDGEGYSDVLTTSFKFKKSEEPGFGALVAALALVAVIPVALRRRRSQ
jgi:hypothetical protein